MRQRIVITGAASILLCLTASLALGDDGRHGRPAPFVGVFYPVISGVAFDATRCPDPSHPLLFSFTGLAQTTLGRAQFTQSHCEALDHTSFRRGVQVITLESGWQLFGAYHGRLRATPTTGVDFQLVIDGRYRNTGGTGPFKNADGDGISAGTVDVRTGGAVIAVSGTL